MSLLQNIIIDEIRKEGFITFSRYMDLALYHKDYGYYTNNIPIGKDGDFITAPEISQLFGTTLATWIVYAWEKLGSPKKFHLIEIGAGRGTLMSDILYSIRKIPDLYDAINVNIIEVSSSLQNVQKNILSEYSCISWYTELPKNFVFPVIIIANEVLDALPVNQYCILNGILKEKVVIYHNDNLRLEYRNSNFKLEDHDLLLEEGGIIEYSSASMKLISDIRKIITKYTGGVLLIDYGYIVPHFRSTIQSLYKHSFNNVLLNIGKADITYHIDFKKLYYYMKEQCKSLLFTQREFLLTFYIKQHLENFITHHPEREGEFISQFDRLTNNKQMGSLFKVLQSFKT